ncbi:MAG: hypothetical protein ACJAZ3_001021 [Sphingobacteriales bacterium]|jgi:hypothetical protein
MKNIILLLISFLALFGACKKSKMEEPVVLKNLSQYADKVIDFSSEYSTTHWSAMQLLGAENTYPDYGDLTTAWASKTADGQREHLVLEFDTSQFIKQILIFETFNPGAIDTVYINNIETNNWKKVYTSSANFIAHESSILEIQIPSESFKSNRIRIAINSPAVESYNEIDAVKIVGTY